jgi:hypothetical protein
MWNSLTVVPLGAMSSEGSDTTSEPWYVHLAFKTTRRAEPSVTTDAYTVSAGAKVSRGSATRRLVSRARPRVISVTLTSERSVGLGDGPASGERSLARHPPTTAISAKQHRATLKPAALAAVAAFSAVAGASDRI